MTTLLQDLNFLKTIKCGTIGIIGGSFNPPHQGHLYISNLAIKKLNLNLLLWLVAPSNSLKKQKILLPIEKRVNLCRKLINNTYKIKVSSLEKDLPNNYTYNTIKILSTILSKQIKLIWIMGEDILFSFHKFYKWKELLRIINVVIISRGGINSFESLHQKCSQIMKNNFIDSNNVNKLIKSDPPCWTFWALPKKDISSTQIRNSC